MLSETIFHTLKDGRKVKFSILEVITDEEIKYYARVIDTELDIYKKLSKEDKQLTYGVDVEDGNGQIVYYKGKNALINDLRNEYGIKRLISKI